MLQPWWMPRPSSQFGASYLELCSFMYVASSTSFTAIEGLSDRRRRSTRDSFRASQIHLSVRKCRRPQRCHRHAAQQALLLLFLRDGAGDGCFIFRGAGDGVTRKVETQRGGFDCGAQALRALPVIVWANHRQNSRPRKLETDA